MGNRGESKHLKKLAAPVAWPIQRKNSTWITKPLAGAHPKKESIPLKTVLTEMLMLADTSKEAMKIIKNKEVLVDGKTIREPKFPIGLMDIISIPKIKKNYIVSYTVKGKIILNEIEEKEASTKLCKVKNKTRSGKDTMQITLHDGKNIIVKKDDYKTGDSVKITIPKQEIKEHFAMAKGNMALITGGKHSGETGKIEEVQPGTEKRETIIKIKTQKRELLTPKNYVFVIGKEKAAIPLGR